MSGTLSHMSQGGVDTEFTFVFIIGYNKFSHCQALSTWL